MNKRSTQFKIALIFHVLLASYWEPTLQAFPQNGLEGIKEESISGYQNSDYLKNVDQSVLLLRKYCKACHAINPNKFITSENNLTVWKFIQNAKTKDGVLWIDAIERTLDWPSKTPPDRSIAPGREYMPKGAKRYKITREKMGPIDAREYLLEKIRNAR